MATSTVDCSICDLRHISRPSSHWCSECSEYLCPDCKDHHSLAKLSRGHAVIPVEDYQKLPSFISEIQSSCSEHNETYQLYCLSHDRELCLKCVKVHNTCTDVIPLDEVVKDVKTSEVFRDLEQSIADMTENIVRIKKDRENNMSSIRDQKVAHITEVREKRNLLNKHLDKLEEQLIKELDEIEENAARKIKKCITDLTDTESQLAEFQKATEDIRKYASDHQTYIGIKKIQANVNGAEQFLQSLVDDQSLGKANISCTVDSKVIKILTSVKSFGSVELKIGENTTTLLRKKDKQAQILTKTKVKGINDIALKLQEEITCGSHRIRGCCVTADGTLVLTYHLKQMLMFIGPNGIDLDSMTIPDFAMFDVTNVDNSSIAVTSGDSKKQKGLKIIDFAAKNIVHFVSLPGQTYGITKSQENLFCAVSRFGIYQISCNDFSVELLVSCSNMKCNAYIAVCSGKLYYTHGLASKVNCIDMTGNILWEFDNEYILKYPRGITLDMFGNVYVADEDNCNVVAFSSDGKEYKQILSQYDGLKSPSAVFYDKEKNHLIVANIKESVKIFNFV